MACTVNAAMYRLCEACRLCTGAAARALIRVKKSRIGLRAAVESSVEHNVGLHFVGADVGLGA